MKNFMQIHFRKNIRNLEPGLSNILPVALCTKVIMTEQHKNFYPAGEPESSDWSASGGLSETCGSISTTASLNAPASGINRLILTI